MYIKTVEELFFRANLPQDYYALTQYDFNRAQEKREEVLNQRNAFLTTFLEEFKINPNSIVSKETNDCIGIFYRITFTTTNGDTGIIDIDNSHNILTENPSLIQNIHITIQPNGDNPNASKKITITWRLVIEESRTNPFVERFASVRVPEILEGNIHGIYLYRISPVGITSAKYYTPGIPVDCTKKEWEVKIEKTHNNVPHSYTYQIAGYDAIENLKRAGIPPIAETEFNLESSKEIPSKAHEFYIDPRTFIEKYSKSNKKTTNKKTKVPVHPT